jgi:hypothetical protein
MTVKSSLPLETASGSGDANAPSALDDATKIVVAHLVAQETKSLTDEIATLTDKLAVAEKALTTKDAEHAAFKQDIADKAELAKLATMRTAEVAKALPALDATPERVERWASMSDTEFAAYLVDVASVAGVQKPAGSFDESKTVETAMSRAKKDNKPTTDETGAGRSVLGL